jgi:hypothetical protein
MQRCDIKFGGKGHGTTDKVLFPAKNVFLPEVCAGLRSVID